MGSSGSRSSEDELYVWSGPKTSDQKYAEATERLNQPVSKTKQQTEAEASVRQLQIDRCYSKSKQVGDAWVRLESSNAPRKKVSEALIDYSNGTRQCDTMRKNQALDSMSDNDFRRAAKNGNESLNNACGIIKDYVPDANCVSNASVGVAEIKSTDSQALREYEVQECRDRGDAIVRASIDLPSGVVGPVMDLYNEGGNHCTHANSLTDPARYPRKIFDSHLNAGNQALTRACEEIKRHNPNVLCAGDTSQITGSGEECRVGYAITLGILIIMLCLFIFLVVMLIRRDVCPIRLDWFHGKIERKGL